jgi:hypothetical protein
MDYIMAIKKANNKSKLPQKIQTRTANAKSNLAKLKSTLPPDILERFEKIHKASEQMRKKREANPIILNDTSKQRFAEWENKMKLQEQQVNDWKDITWYSDKGKKYLRIWVDGKTGGRWLIAKHDAVDVLKRLHSRQEDVRQMEFEDLLKSTNQQKIFRFSDGYQPPSLNGTFRRLMRECGLEKGEDGQNRTLYSIRHTYATLELLEKGTNIHTLSKQMGNSAAMIKRN